MSILEVKNIRKKFENIEVLKGIDFSLEKGGVLSIIGSSGSGKTTLLRCLNFLETPDEGIIKVNDEILFDSSDPLTRSESQIRKKRLHFGLVFQSFNLFPQYTALENIMLAPKLAAKEKKIYDSERENIKSEAVELLKKVGLEKHMNKKPKEVSSKESQ